LRELAWTILFPALCGLVALGAVACIMMVQFVCEWAKKKCTASKKFEFRAFLMLAGAFGPVALGGTILSPYRIILLPDWLVRIIISAVVFAMWLIVRNKAQAQPSSAGAPGGLYEALGMATLAREANPGAEVGTLGELVSLGEEEVRRQVDDDTSGT
jgi:hypothetical protein